MESVFSLFIQMNKKCMWIRDGSDRSRKRGGGGSHPCWSEKYTIKTCFAVLHYMSFFKNRTTFIICTTFITNILNAGSTLLKMLYSVCFLML